MVKWIDIDFDRRVVRIIPEKGSKPRILLISVKLVEMVKSLPRKSERVFLTTYHTIHVNFYRLCRMMAET